MDISGKVVVFVNALQNKEGKEVKNYSAYINAKNKDNSYTKMSAKVKFVGENFTEANLAKLTPDFAWEIEVREGFLSCETYTDKNNNKRYVPVFCIKKAKILKQTELVHKDKASNSAAGFDD